MDDDCEAKQWIRFQDYGAATSLNFLFPGTSAMAYNGNKVLLLGGAYPREIGTSYSTALLMYNIETSSFYSYFSIAPGRSHAS